MNPLNPRLICAKFELYWALSIIIFNNLPLKKGLVLNLISQGTFVSWFIGFGRALLKKSKKKLSVHFSLFHHFLPFEVVTLHPNYFISPLQMLLCQVWLKFSLKVLEKKMKIWKLNHTHQQIIDKFWWKKSGELKSDKMIIIYFVK